MKYYKRYYKLLLLKIFTFCILLSYSSINASAGVMSDLKDIFKCRGNIEINYDSESLLNNPIKPLDPAREIKLDIYHKVSGGYSDHIVERYLSTNSELFNRLHLRLVEKPDWCTVSILPDFIVNDLSTEWSYVNTSLFLTLKENAPAYKEENIIIEIWGEPIGKGIIYTPPHMFNITFTSGYSPLLKITTPSGTTKMTNPDQTVYFDVEIENYGNAKTIVECNALNIPEGWRVEVPSNFTLGSIRFGDDNTKNTITISVHPPVSFGYHEDRETLQFSFIPAYYDNTSIKGEEHILSFIVQSEGYSNPGFEFVLLFFSIIGFIIIKKRFGKRRDI